MEMEIARELSLNMETKITMEPRRGEEEEGNKLHSYPSLPSNTWSVLAIQLVTRLVLLLFTISPARVK